MDIHKRIEELRRQRKWSRSKLAKEAGLSETTVYDWFNENHYTSSRSALEDVCAAFGISLAEFYCDVEIDRLTPDEMRLLECYRKLTENKKTAALAVMKSLVD